MSVEEGAETHGSPSGASAVPVAVLLTTPASTSAWPIGYVASAVQVVAAPGAKVVTGQVTAPAFGSLIATAWIVVVPVF